MRGLRSHLHLFSSAIAHNLEQNTALHKEHYISSAKTYDGKDPREFNNRLDNVNRLSRILGNNQLDIAIATSIGQLHKYTCELVGLGLNWDMIRGSNNHFIKDCPFNRDNDKKDSSPIHGQHKHYSDYRSKSVDENSIVKSMQAYINTCTQTNIQITNCHTNSQTRDLTNQPIGETTTKANIGIIGELENVSVTVLQAVLTNQMKGRNLIHKSFPPKMIQKTRLPLSTT